MGWYVAHLPSSHQMAVFPLSWPRDPTPLPLVSAPKHPVPGAGLLADSHGVPMSTAGMGVGQLPFLRAESYAPAGTEHIQGWPTESNFPYFSTGKPLLLAALVCGPVAYRCCTLYSRASVDFHFSIPYLSALISGL